MTGNELLSVWLLVVGFASAARRGASTLAGISMRPAIAHSAKVIMGRTRKLSAWIKRAKPSAVRLIGLGIQRCGGLEAVARRAESEMG